MADILKFEKRAEPGTNTIGVAEDGKTTINGKAIDTGSSWAETPLVLFLQE